MAMKYYKLVGAWRVGIEPPMVQPKPPKPARQQRMFQLSTAKELTLAEYNPVSREAITAHHIADYRRRHFSLTLLPDAHVVLEDLLAPVEVEYVSL